MKKRICLFAGYSSQQRIEDYVVFYVKSLNEFADVYYCADNDLSEDEINKLRPFAKDVFHGKHSKYDFGSWAKIINSLGWDKIEEYDELLLVNDSCFGPLYSLSPVFEKMDRIECDAWGIVKNNFLMSFFLCIKRKVFKDQKLRDFFQSLQCSNRKMLFLQYETVLSDILSAYGTAAYLDKKDLKSLYKQHKKEIKQKLRSVLPSPFWWLVRKRMDKIRLYDNEALFLPFLGFPFLKKKAFFHMESLIPKYGLKYVELCTDYNPDMISVVLQKTGVPAPSLRQYVLMRLKIIFNRNKRHLLKRFGKEGK